MEASELLVDLMKMSKEQLIGKYLLLTAVSREHEYRADRLMCVLEELGDEMGSLKKSLEVEGFCVEKSNVEDKNEEENVSGLEPKSKRARNGCGGEENTDGYLGEGREMAGDLPQSGGSRSDVTQDQGIQSEPTAAESPGEPASANTISPGQ